MLKNILGTSNIIVTGQVASGKTTTLAGIIEVLLPDYTSVDVFTPYCKQLMRYIKNDKRITVSSEENTERIFEMTKHRTPQSNTLLVVDDLNTISPSQCDVLTAITDRYTKFVFVQQSHVSTNSYASIVRKCRAVKLNVYYITSEMINGVCYVSDEIERMPLKALLRTHRRVRTVNSILTEANIIDI